MFFNEVSCQWFCTKSQTWTKSKFLVFVSSKTSASLKKVLGIQKISIPQVKGSTFVTALSTELLERKKECLMKVNYQHHFMDVWKYFIQQLLCFEIKNFDTLFPKIYTNHSLVFREKYIIILSRKHLLNFGSVFIPEFF